jgi:hypothetical protein
MTLALTPTEELICDVLVARLRLGETMWTFDSRLTAQGVHLAELGIIGTTHGIVEKTFRAWLTDKGKALFLMDSYVPPIDKGKNVEQARHVRNAEGFIAKAAMALSEREFESNIRMAEVYASLALAVDGEKS